MLSTNIFFGKYQDDIGNNHKNSWAICGNYEKQNLVIIKIIFGN